jgi:hypothetical protein
MTIAVICFDSRLISTQIRILVVRCNLPTLYAHQVQHRLARAYRDSHQPCLESVDIRVG